MSRSRRSPASPRTRPARASGHAGRCGRRCPARRCSPQSGSHAPRPAPRARPPPTGLRQPRTPSPHPQRSSPTGTQRWSPRHRLDHALDILPGGDGRERQRLHHAVGAPHVSAEVGVGDVLSLPLPLLAQLLPPTPLCAVPPLALALALLVAHRSPPIVLTICTTARTAFDT